MKDPAHLNSVKPVYHPFGMLLTGRSWEAGSEYRYGFNGKENVDEIYGIDVTVDFGARIYNARIGRWFSIDPLQHLQPSQSPYKAFMNSPISVVDPDGKTEWLVTIFYDETTGMSTARFVVINPDKEILKVSQKKAAWSGDPTKAMSVYDVFNYQVVTKHANGEIKMTTSTAEFFTGNYRSYWKLFREIGNGFRDMGDFIERHGTGGSQSGGFVITTDGPIIDPTKYTSDNASRTINLDDFLTVMNAMNSTFNLGETGGFTKPEAETYAEVIDLTKDFIETSFENGAYSEEIKLFYNGMNSGVTIPVCKWHFENISEGNKEKYTHEDHGNGIIYVPKEVYDFYWNEPQKNE